MNVLEKGVDLIAKHDAFTIVVMKDVDHSDAERFAKMNNWKLTENDVTWTLSIENSGWKEIPPPMWASLEVKESYKKIKENLSI